jgi:RNA polymerase sigma factor for flagellar operon FliA
MSAPDMVAGEESEAELWQALRERGDSDARLRIIELYTEFARMLAAKLFSTRPDDAVPFDDYLQHGRVGLIEAVDRFDPARGTSFEGYASHRIRGTILNGVARDTEQRAQHSQWRARVAERRESLAGAAGGDPASATLEDFARLAVGLAIGMMLDDPERVQVDDSVEGNPYASAALAQTRERVRALVEQLPARERAIVRQHYYEQREFQELAAEMAVTKGRVSQLHSQALDRIREGVNVRPRVDRKV